MIAILAGLPIAVALAWVFDITPEGVRVDSPATSDAPASAPEARPDDIEEGSHKIDRPPPAAASAMIGRDEDVSAVVELLAAGRRLVTVTGPGGTGKTTLASEVARRTVEAFSDGVAYVTLVGVPEADQVMSALALSLDVADVEGRAPAEGLAKVIGDGRVLLVLDNFEHVLDAAPEVATLLGACPDLQVLATSRAPLRVADEQEYTLSPLGLPPSGAEALDDVLGSPAVELFVARASQARPDFKLDGTNASEVAAICRRLDGLPLALELAAARVRVLQPADLLQRLESALDVLTTGARDLPERQRTLRSTIDWSHSLLDEAEQRLFRRLAVFADGWTHDAVEAVCDPDGEGEVLEEVTSLVEKGLVSRDGSGRFTMLQTILDYASEQLDASNERDRYRNLHAEHYRGFAQRLERGLEAVDGDQVQWMHRGAREDGNLTAALAWLHAQAASGDVDAVEEGLATCGALMLYWHIRAQHVRMLEAIDSFLECRSTEEPTLAWAAAMNSRSMASMSVGDLPAAIEECRAAMEAAEALGYERGAALYTWMLGVHHLVAGDFDEAGPLLEVGTERSRAVGYDFGEGLARAFHGMLATATGQMAAAREHFTAALAIQERIGDIEGGGVALSGLAMLTMAEGDSEEAMRLYRRARDAFTTIGDGPEVARVLDEMAWCALGTERPERGRPLFLESMRQHDSVGSARGVGLAMMGLAAAEVVDGRVERGLIVSAAADAFSEQEGVVVSYPWVFAAKERLAEAIGSIPPDRVASLTEQGRGMSADEVLAFVMEPSETLPVV